jgi:hypothetical protein
MAPAQGLGAGFCTGDIWGERRQSSRQRSKRADHIPFSGAVLFCSLFEFAQIELTFGPASSSPRLGGPKVTPSAQSQWPYAVGVAGGVTVLSRLEMAVTSCAGAKGLASITLFGTPMEAHFSPWVPVI